MNTRGILLVVSGFAGSGKGTVMKALMKEHDNYALSVSATTRKPRPGEENGREYFFVTKEKFESMIANEELLEYAQYVDNYYGTPKFYVDEQLAAGKDVILEIETQGALLIKEKYPDTLLCFVMPPDIKELHRRLVDRGTETSEVINARMQQGIREADAIEKYDYLVINDEVGECVRRLHETIQSAHYSTSRNKDMINKVKEEFREFLK